MARRKSQGIKKYSAFIIVLIFIFIFSRQNESETSGKVVYVTDGDTFHMLIDGEKVKVRMAGIDAPETSQPYGLEAKEHLMSMIKENEVSIIVDETDRYGRLVAYVYLDGKDINREMILSGYAWWYEKYAPNKVDYQAAQVEAKAKRKGLWAQPKPIAPWNWRRRLSFAWTFSSLRSGACLL